MKTVSGLTGQLPPFVSAKTKCHENLDTPSIWWLLTWCQIKYLEFQGTKFEIFKKQLFISFSQKPALYLQLRKPLHALILSYVLFLIIGIMGHYDAVGKSRCQFLYR